MLEIVAVIVVLALFGLYQLGSLGLLAWLAWKIYHGPAAADRPGDVDTNSLGHCCD
jgi:hypothetical protein